MTLRTFLLSAAVVSFTLAGTPAMAQSDDAPKIKTESISDGLYRLTGPGGNIGVSVGDDGVFVIDDKFVNLNVCGIIHI